ncbi:serine hydrolase [Bdellovibrionota bacterium FG-2]
MRYIFCFALLSLALLPLASASTLEDIFASQGYVPPKTLRAVVFQGKGEEFDVLPYLNTATDRDTWWPASEIKLFAAIAALEAAERRGFTPAVLIEFTGETLPPGWTPKKAWSKATLKQILEAAIIESDNIAFDRLIHWVGFDEFYATFLNSKRGFTRTSLMRGYSRLYMTPDGKHGTLKISPALTAREGTKIYKRAKLKATFNPKPCGFSEEGNCTTVEEIGRALLRAMRPERSSAPGEDGYKISKESLSVLHAALQAPRPRGMQIVEGLQRGLSKAGVSTAGWIFAHKPGFAIDWMSDVVYVENPVTQQWWIVSMVGYPGRESLSTTSEAVGHLLGDR